MALEMPQGGRYPVLDGGGTTASHAGVASVSLGVENERIRCGVAHWGTQKVGQEGRWAQGEG